MGGRGGDRKCSNMPLKLIVLHASRKYNPPTHLKNLATSYYSKKNDLEGRRVHMNEQLE